MVPTRAEGLTGFARASFFIAAHWPLLPHPIPIAARSYILRGPARGQTRFKRQSVLGAGALISVSLQGMDERKPLIRLGS